MRHYTKPVGPQPAVPSANAFVIVAEPRLSNVRTDTTTECTARREIRRTKAPSTPLLLRPAEALFFSRAIRMPSTAECVTSCRTHARCSAPRWPERAHHHNARSSAGRGRLGMPCSTTGITCCDVLASLCRTMHAVSDTETRRLATASCIS